MSLFNPIDLGLVFYYQAICSHNTNQNKMSLQSFNSLWSRKISEKNELTRYGLVVTEIWVNTDSGNGLLPDSTKPLPESMLTDYQWSPVTFIWG